MSSKLSSTLSFLGTGNMAEAIISGLVGQKIVPGKNIRGFDLDIKKLQALKKKYGITPVKTLNDAALSDIIVLSVKPQQFSELLPKLATLLRKDALIISIAAGIDTSSIAKRLGRKTRVIRVMPNTPLLVGLGASVYVATKSCTSTDKKNAEAIFGAAGLVLETKKEDLLDAVTGLSGSGPAYVYQFAQGLIDGGIATGLKADMARKLAIATLRGATQLLEDSGEEPDELTAKVASKGGTTEAALKYLATKKFKTIVADAVTTATKRARQLRTLQ
jgi:pyrroline-5-carboxylate reductase